MTAMPDFREKQQAVTAAGSRIFYGWWIVGSGFLVNTFNGALVFHAFGAYVVLLEDEFGWSRTTFAFAFALQRIESGLLGPIEGWAIDRFGPRKVMMLGLVIFALGFIALSQINSILTFYLAFLMIALGSVLGSFLPVTVAVVNWFNRRRAFALAMVSMGFAAGGLIQPGVVFLLAGHRLARDGRCLGHLRAHHRPPARGTGAAPPRGLRDAAGRRGRRQPGSATTAGARLHRPPGAAHARLLVHRAGPQLVAAGDWRGHGALRRAPQRRPRLLARVRRVDDHGDDRRDGHRPDLHRRHTGGPRSTSA